MRVGWRSWRTLRLGKVRDPCIPAPPGSAQCRAENPAWDLVVVHAGGWRRLHARVCVWWRRPCRETRGHFCLVPSWASGHLWTMHRRLRPSQQATYPCLSSLCLSRRGCMSTGHGSHLGLRSVCRQGLEKSSPSSPSVFSLVSSKHSSALQRQPQGHTVNARDQPRLAKGPGKGISSSL